MSASVAMKIPTATEGLEVQIDGGTFQFKEFGTVTYNHFVSQIWIGVPGLMDKKISMWSPQLCEFVRIPVGELMEALEKRAGEKSD